MKPEYDEPEELRRYVWRNYRHALSAREHALRAAATLELKALHAGTADSAARLRQMAGVFYGVLCSVRRVRRDTGHSTLTAEY